MSRTQQPPIASCAACGGRGGLLYEPGLISSVCRTCNGTGLDPAAHGRRELRKLAQEVIDLQDACNPLGLSKRYAQALAELHAALKLAGLPNDTDAVCFHPVNQLWVSKLHDLADMGLSCEARYGRAYEALKKLAQGG